MLPSRAHLPQSCPRNKAYILGLPPKPLETTLSTSELLTAPLPNPSLPLERHQLQWQRQPGASGRLHTHVTSITTLKYSFLETNTIGSAVRGDSGHMQPARCWPCASDLLMSHLCNFHSRCLKSTPPIPHLPRHRTAQHTAETLQPPSITLTDLGHLGIPVALLE